MTDSLLIDVAVPLPVDQTFSYAVPPRLAGQVAVGCRVLVPFGRRTVTGYVLGTGAAQPGEMREIRELLDKEPLFTPHHLEFYRWVANYYCHPLGDVIRTALPAGLTIMGKTKLMPTADGTLVPAEVVAGGQRCKTERCYAAVGGENPPSLKGKALAIREILLSSGEALAGDLRRRFGPCSPQLARLVELGLATCREREVYRDPFREEVFAADTPLPLTTAQAAALAGLGEALDRRGFAPFLLHGVTGSGKTEVYLQAIAHCLAQDRTALVLVPEIALTPQLVERFKRRFSCGIAVLHSGLTDGERYDEWRRIRRGEAPIVIGARSAIFAPLERLGMIVVDEEHEASYKQSDGCRYNARDLALVLGKRHDAVVLLGSATPLVTTLHAVRQGKLVNLELPERVNSLPMPETVILDARGRKNEILLPELVHALTANLASGGQTLLFLNRRGFATWLVCKDCGNVLRCPNCAVTLTFHQQRQRHLCHYCDYSIPAPSICPACESGEIGLLGLGTERLEEEVKALFPAARVARMDRDTTSGRGGHAKILRQLASGAIDILIGTQMIAKGHDFP
ncbi:MAG TPA: primosomal protein N', partial [Geobacteraceae bacterium]